MSFEMELVQENWAHNKASMAVSWIWNAEWKSRDAEEAFLTGNGECVSLASRQSVLHNLSLVNTTRTSHGPTPGFLRAPQAPEDHQIFPHVSHRKLRISSAQSVIIAKIRTEPHSSHTYLGPFTESSRQYYVFPLTTSVFFLLSFPTKRLLGKKQST